MNTSEPEDLSGLIPLTMIQRQAGVIPYMATAEGLKLVVVTSRRTGRWVFPKGSIDDGMTPQEAAAQEAFEEAGLIGVAAPESLGSYQALKIRPPAVWTIEVDLYPMRIEEVLDLWIEADQRARKFVSPDEAAALLGDPVLSDLALALAHSDLWR
jgi:8-oxo-dGTP pyrophosphatase MutT (NUDIX family)